MLCLPFRHRLLLYDLSFHGTQKTTPLKANQMELPGVACTVSKIISLFSIQNLSPKCFLTVTKVQ